MTTASTASQLQRHRPQEVRDKISKALKNRPRPEAVKKRISAGVKARWDQTPKVTMDDIL